MRIYRCLRLRPYRRRGAHLHRVHLRLPGPSKRMICLLLGVRGVVRLGFREGTNCPARWLILTS